MTNGGHAKKAAHFFQQLLDFSSSSCLRVELWGQQLVAVVVRLRNLQRVVNIYYLRVCKPRHPVIILQRKASSILRI
jgi:hypothetical protein